MKSFILQLISDTGNLSMTRFLSLVCVFSAVLISVVALYRGSAPDSVVGLVSVFLAAGFGGKIAQKFVEVKDKSEDSETQNETK